MPRLAPPPLKLSETEREQLQLLVNRHSTPQQIALRARIILLADEGENDRAIARSLELSRDMTWLWRNRWLGLAEKEVPVIERLQDAQRSGGPSTFSLEQILQLFAGEIGDSQIYANPSRLLE